jgi:hypothetical protein
MRRATAAAITILLVVLCLVSLMPRASAQGGAFDVMVYPAKLELAGAPGTTQTFVINVRNLGPNTETMSVYFNDYFIKANNDFVFQKPGHYSYSCANWLSTDTPAMVVPSGQTVAKTFTLTVPAKAEPGGHYGVIFFEQAPQAGEPPVKARPRIGSLMLVTVPGEIIREGEIKSVSVTSSWFWPAHKLPILPRRRVTARIVFYNSGNVHLTVRGFLSYKASFGWGSGKVEFNEITVLPKTTRYLEASIPSPPLVGSFSVKAAIQYGPSLDVFTITKERNGAFSMYPLSLLGILLILIAIIIALFLLRGRRKRKAASAGEAAEPHEDGGSKDAGKETRGDKPEKEEAPVMAEEAGSDGPEKGPEGDAPEEDETTQAAEPPEDKSEEEKSEPGEDRAVEEEKNEGAAGGAPEKKVGGRFKVRRK